MHVRLLLTQHLFAVAASLFASMQRTSRKRPFNATYPGEFHTELSTRHVRVHTSRDDAALDRFMWSPEQKLRRYLARSSEPGLLAKV